MDTNRNLGELAREIQHLESDAFKISDFTDPAELLHVASTTSTFGTGAAGLEVRPWVPPAPGWTSTSACCSG